MKETLVQFSARMEQVEKTCEHTVGRAYQGNSRATFNFDGMECYLESSGYRTTPAKSPLSAIAKAVFIMAVEPRDSWWTDYMVYGRTKAEQVAKHYNGRTQEAYYAEEEGAWFHLVFDTFETLMAFCYDRKTGAFDKQWQISNPAFVDCLGETSPA